MAQTSSVAILRLQSQGTPLLVVPRVIRSDTNVGIGGREVSIHKRQRELGRAVIHIDVGPRPIAREGDLDRRRPTRAAETEWVIEAIAYYRATDLLRKSFMSSNDGDHNERLFLAALTVCSRLPFSRISRSKNCFDETTLESAIGVVVERRGVQL